MSTKDTAEKVTSARLVEVDEEAINVIESEPQDKRSNPVVALQQINEKGFQKPATEVTSAPPVAASESTKVATPKTLFLRRLFAWMTDSVVISFLAGIAVFITVNAFQIAHDEDLTLLTLFAPERLLIGGLFCWIATGIYNFTPALSIYLILNIMLKNNSSLYGLVFAGASFLVASLVQQAYYVCFIASHLRATPGKILFGLKVESESGIQASKLSILTRELTKAASTGFICIPLLITWLFPGRRFLHEALSWTKVMPEEHKARSKFGSALAPLAACTSTLLIGFVVCQLLAPLAYEFSISPKLAICKITFGAHSKPYRDQLWEHIDSIFYRYKNPSNRSEQNHSLTPHELAVFDEEIEQLSKYENPSNPRFRAAYRDAIRHFDFKDAGATKERYLRRFIYSNEGTKDQSFLQTLFHCSDGHERNAYGALADHLISMGERTESKDKAKEYFRQAWIAGVRGTVKLEGKSAAILVDAVATKARAAQQFKDKAILAAALKELIPLEITLYENSKGDTYPREISGVGSVYELFNDLLALAEFQVNRNDFAGLDKTLSTMTSIFEKYRKVDTWVEDRFRRISPDEATQLEHYARLCPKYAKTLNFMAGNR